ncbi:MAG: FAD-dependent oxidoreductase [Balneolaceae bacterium]
MNQKRVIVVGAGVAGLFSAYYLKQAGFDVTVIDKGNGTDNCSYGNAGMIVPSHIIPLSSPGVISKGLRWMLDAESPFYIRPRLSLDLISWLWKFKQASTKAHVEESGPILRDLLLSSRQLLLNLESDENFEFSFEKKGLFMFCNTEKGLDKEREIADKANSLGIPAETLSSEEVGEMEKDLSLDIVGATYYPKDAHLHPGSLMNGLKDLLMQRDVHFKYNTVATSLRTENGRVKEVKTGNGENLEADYVVLCPGAWSGEFLGRMGHRMPMQAGKGYSITLQNPPVLPGYCGILAEKKVTLTPINNTLRFAGTMEIVGTDTQISPKKISGLKKSVLEYLPQFSPEDLEGHKVWTGLRPCSPDGLPYVGRIDTYENLFTSTGHAMMGMSLAPSCGKIVADLIAEETSDLYDQRINPNRYT